MCKKISAFFVFMAAFLWGLIGFFTTNLSTAGFTNMQIIFIRASITTLFLGITLLIRGKGEFKVKFKDLWMFFGMGFISFCIFNFCYFTSMKLNNSLSTACILMYTAPVFVMLMSLILFKEKITKIKVISVILAILGCVFVCGIGKITPIGFLFGIGSGIGYALYSIFGTFAIKKYSTYTSTFYAFLFGAIGAFFMCDAKGAIILMTQSTHNFLLCFLIAVLITLVPYILYTKGLEKVEASKAIIIACIEPVVATLLGIFMYNQNLSFLSFVGMILIMIAVCILNIKKK